MTAPEIIDKLRPKLLEEGPEVEFLNVEQATVNIRARRVSPGVPVAFLVKAIAGTYRRYLPEIEDVCLAEYDPGESIPTAPSKTFEPIFQHRSPLDQLKVQGMPVVTLAGLNRREAVQAMESFFRLWSKKSPILGVAGLSEDAPLRALKKWTSFYRDEFREVRKLGPDRWNILVDSPETAELESLELGPEELMPGKIFLASGDEE